MKRLEEWWWALTDNQREFIVFVVLGAVIGVAVWAIIMATKGLLW